MPGPKRRTCALLLGLAVLLSGCISEQTNRDIYAFNEKFDTVVFGPVLLVYDFLLPPPAQEGVTNFFANLRYGDVVANQLLQGKVVLAYKDFQRWTVNTVWGLGGVIDVASKLGMEAHSEDFGQTLGVWGAKEGRFVVLPILGPATWRDAVGRLVGFATSPTLYVNLGPLSPAVTVLSFASQRLEAEAQLERVRQEATDEYLFVKNAYLQRRRFETCDGNVEAGEGLEELDELDGLDGADDGLPGLPDDEGGLPGLDDLGAPPAGRLPGLDDLEAPDLPGGALPGLDDVGPEAPSGGLSGPDDLGDPPAGNGGLPGLDDVPETPPDGG